MKFSKRRVFVLLSVLVLVLSLTVGAASAASHTDDMFNRLRTVFNVVQAWDKDGADVDKFVNGAIKGGLEALGDPYTNYFTPQDYQSFMSSLNGQFSGIGAYLEQDDKYVVISAPIKDTPAFKAGLESGDRILEADGKNLVGVTTEVAVQYIRGPEGSQVTLKVERPSENRTFTVTITRAVINVPEVDSKMLDGNIGYVAIYSFGDNAATDFYKAVNELKAQGAKGLILDLRQNPGGYLDAAVSVASAFVPAGQPVVWEVSKGQKTSLNSSGTLINLPAAVLVDNGSASASEILSGAIQDYGVAPLVGIKTFGKGTVQQILNLTDGGGMKVTIAEYLTPKERHVHGIGLTPDYVVENPKPDPEHTNPLEFKRFLNMTSVGLDVLYLQYRLEDLGYDPDVDGFFGLKTQDAVLKFSRDNFLGKQSVVDATFIDKLNQKVAEHWKKAEKDDLQMQKALELVQEKLK